MHAASPPDNVRNILIVTYEYPPLGGGGGVIIRDLAEELAKERNVTVLTTARVGLSPDERAGKLHIVRVPVMFRTADAVASMPSMLSFFPSSLRVGRRLMREESFDIVHTGFAIPSGPSGLLLARGQGLPHILSLMGGDVYDPTKRLSPHRTPLLKQTVRAVMRGSTRVVANSIDIRARAQDIYGVTDVGLIPLAIKPVEAAPASRAEVGLAAEDIALITVGRLVERKGLDQLIDVLAEVADPRLKLVVVGEGPKREVLEAQARDRGVADRIFWQGFVWDERKWQLLRMADLYVSTAVHEGFGIVFIEGMENSLPVICYDCGGQTDFLRPEFSRLAPVNNKAAFAEALTELAGDPDLRARMGEVAREAAADYHIDRYAERYLDVYRAAIRAKRGG